MEGRLLNMNTGDKYTRNGIEIVVRYIENGLVFYETGGFANCLFHMDIDDFKKSVETY